jgi:P pilus assembly chaperone PapD
MTTREYPQNASSTGTFGLLVKVSFSLGLLILSHLSNANNVSLSTQRIFLDQESPNANFEIKNREIYPQECKLGITYNDFDEIGNMLPYLKSEPPLNAAEKVARFSPKNFRIEPNSKQVVRFTLRRKHDTPPIEHRSYLTVACKNLIDNRIFKVADGQTSIPINPQLQHNIPLIVRPKALSVELRFSDVALKERRLTFKLHREGTRSVYGKVKLVDKQNGETVDESGSFAIYHETKEKLLLMAVPQGLSLNNIKLEFNEAKEEGNAVATWQNSSDS